MLVCLPVTLKYALSLSMQEPLAKINNYKNEENEQRASQPDYFDFLALRNSIEFLTQCQFYTSGEEVSTFFGCYTENFFRAETFNFPN